MNVTQPTAGILQVAVASRGLGLLSTQADASSLVAGLAASMGVAVGFGFVAGHRRTRMTRSSR
jgi:SSS family solute:Na+ symporter